MPTLPTVQPLDMHLLGEFRLISADAPLSPLPAPRVQALLAYLVLHRAAPQPRQRLAFLLWPDTSDAQARTNLRQLLHTVRQALPVADTFVRTEGPTLHWRSDAPFRLDVADFETALAQAESAERQGDAPTLRAALEQAVALYHGDLLPSCYDDWILPERERLRQAYAGALERLVQLLESQGETRAALASAQRLLRHDPLREETYRALMRLYAACGDRAGVRRVYQTCATVLERELGVAPSMATRHAYEQSLKMEIQAQAGPVTTAHAPPAKTNLPIQLTSFVGRVRELAELTSLLLAIRLLTLTGSGGAGKTRLALQLAADVRKPFAAGVWLVELAPLADPALIPHTVATTLGVREQPGRSILDALVDYLRPKALLLLLDNCEHVIEPCAELAETLLRAAPGLHILASSREALGVAGETAYRVPSLPLPGPRQAHDLDALAQNDSVRLFVERAAAAYPPFRLTATNAPAIVQICRRLDGIPLALELAAARVKVFPPEQIAARLGDRFHLLTGGSRTALPRHQTLLALIEWSHQLLSEAERVLLRRLSVFAGGFSLEAAQAVCGEELGVAGQGEGDALETLAHLVDKSLVEVDTPQGAAEGRYRLLETIRQYAREKLVAAGEAEWVRDRHLEYFVQFAEEAEPWLRGGEQLAWLDRVEREHDNVRAALAWPLESGKSERALGLAGALCYFWELRGYWSEGRRWLNDALELSARQQSARAAVGEISNRSRMEMAQRAKVLYGAGRIRFLSQFDPHTSRTIVEESLRVWRELDDTWWTAVALEHVGFMSMIEDVQTARAHLEEGVSLARQVEDRWPLAMCLVRLGSVVPLTEHAAARPIREEAVAVARSVGDKGVLSQGLIGLAVDHLLEGNLTAAAPAVEEALAEARAIGSVTQIFLSLLLLVTISCLQGELVQANGYCVQALALARETGSPQWLSLVLMALGMVACFGGRPLHGVRLLAATETLLRQRGINIRVEGVRDLMALELAVDTGLETAHAHLDPPAFEVALQEGRALTLEQALALVTDNESV